MTEPDNPTVLRKAPRALFKHLVFIHGECGLMLNASVSGARISIDSYKINTRIGDTIEFLWQPLCNMKGIPLMGTCVWMSGHEIGLKFDALSPRVAKLISALVRFHKHTNEAQIDLSLLPPFTSRPID